MFIYYKNLRRMDKSKVHLEESLVQYTWLFIPTSVYIHLFLVCCSAFLFMSLLRKNVFIAFLISLFLRNWWQCEKWCRKYSYYSENTGFHLKHCPEEDIQPFELSIMDEWNVRLTAKYLEGTSRILSNYSREWKKKLASEIHIVKDLVFS